MLKNNLKWKKIREILKKKQEYIFNKKENVNKE